MTLESQIIRFLKEKHEWHHKGFLTERVWTNPKNRTRYMPETVGRTLRILEESSIVACKPEGKSVLYKYMPSIGYYRDEYIPRSARRHGQETILFKRNLPKQQALAL